jgi:hypothetical protein
MLSINQNVSFYVDHLWTALSTSCCVQDLINVCGSVTVCDTRDGCLIWMSDTECPCYLPVYLWCPLSQPFGFM